MNVLSPVVSLNSSRHSVFSMNDFRHLFDEQNCFVCFDCRLVDLMDQMQDKQTVEILFARCFSRKYGDGVGCSMYKLCNGERRKDQVKCHWNTSTRFMPFVDSRINGNMPGHGLGIFYLVFPSRKTRNEQIGCDGMQFDGDLIHVFIQFSLSRRRQLLRWMSPAAMRQLKCGRKA